MSTIGRKVLDREDRLMGDIDVSEILRIEEAFGEIIQALPSLGDHNDEQWGWAAEAAIEGLGIARRLLVRCFNPDNPTKHKIQSVALAMADAGLSSEARARLIEAVAKELGADEETESGAES